MVLSIISLICAGLFFISLGAFEAFAILKLRKIDSNLDLIVVSCKCTEIRKI